jgi:transposase-like protein
VHEDLLGWLQDRLEQASPDLLRDMLKVFAESLMSAEADAVCGAGYGERSPDRVNQRNGYRPRDWDTRVGSIELGLPKLRQGAYFPDWLLQRRRRAEAPLRRSLRRRDLRPSSERRMTTPTARRAAAPSGTQRTAVSKSVSNEAPSMIGRGL